MRQLTPDELNEKINQFISKKRIQRPEVMSLREVKVKQPKGSMRENFRVTVNFIHRHTAPSV